MSIKQSSFVALVVLIVAVSTAAQKALPKKPFEQWSRDEVTKILFDSPWSRMNFDRPLGEYQVTVRLYSALPVRQALVRRMHLTIP